MKPDWRLRARVYMYLYMHQRFTGHAPTQKVMAAALDMQQSQISRYLKELGERRWLQRNGSRWEIAA